MNKNIYYSSLKGLRDQNEDKHNIILNLDNKNCKLNKINYYGIYDGHGGKSVSEFLAKNLPKYFLKKKLSYPVTKDYIRTVYDHVQNVLRNNHKNIAYRTGSTCLIVLQYIKNTKNWLNVLNTGDSRCIICRDNFAHPLTKDHKPGWPEERHRIEKLGGQIYLDGPDFRIGDLSVSRAFGDIEASPYVTHRPDTFKFELDKSDKFIILACDGLWDKVSNEEAVNFVLMKCYDNTTKKRINKRVNIAEELARYSLQKRSTDNISVIVVFFD
jgi:serine/threonine protein phosphatase PrpC